MASSWDREDVTIGEMVEALLVFDEPMLNSRYHGMIARQAEGKMREELVQLPLRVLDSARLTRAGAERWMRGSAHLLDDEFITWGERTLLDSFLGLAESQMRLLAYAARAAPTREIRNEFDHAVRIHREIAGTLREALGLLAHKPPHPAGPSEALRGVQEEAAPGDLRRQLDAAVRSSNAAGHGVRYVTLSHTGLRHLRDQGCFENGETTFLGVPVVVDFGWDVPAFALSTFDAVPLEEIVREAHGPQEGAR